MEATNQLFPDVKLPCFRWTHSVIVPPGHPLLDSPLFASIESFAPTLNRALVEKTLSDEPGTESYDI